MQFFYPSCLQQAATISQIIKFRVCLPYFTFFEFCVPGLLTAIRATMREIPLSGSAFTRTFVRTGSWCVVEMVAFTSRTLIEHNRMLS
jgi:hypothetical protein